MFLKNYFFQNFRGCVLLFSYQGSCQFLTAQIFYHIILRLSRTFSFFCFLCLPLFCDNSDILSCTFLFVKHFFHLFSPRLKGFSGVKQPCPAAFPPRDSFHIIPRGFRSVNPLLLIFLIFSNISIFRH